MATVKFDELLTRLEASVTRIESCCSKGGSSTSGDVAPAFVEEFEQVLVKVSSFVQLSLGISTDVGQIAAALESAFQSVSGILCLAGKCKSPAKDKLTLILKPTLDAIKVAEEVEKKSKDRDHLNHLKAVVAMLGGLTWPGIQSKPQNFVKEMTDSGVFYSNKVLKDFKDKDAKHKEWVQSLQGVFKELFTYVENCHGTGLSWNPKGVEAAGPAASSAPATKAATQKTNTDPNSLFAALNKGQNVTSGLKKVDDSEKTHKNPELRTTSVVQEKAAVAASPAKKTDVAVKPPLFELQNRKWAVEHQKGDQVITIEEGDMSYTLYMFNCVGTTVVVDQKINSITVEACNKCNVVLKAGIISACEVINCKRTNIQADNVTPSVIVGNSDDINIYLNEKAFSTEVVTSKTTGVNVLLMKDNCDLVELNIPEQYVSKVKGGKLVTEQVDVV